jgi:hypothetical protein
MAEVESKKAFFRPIKRLVLQVEIFRKLVESYKKIKAKVEKEHRLAAINVMGTIEGNFDLAVDYFSGVVGQPRVVDADQLMCCKQVPRESINRRKFLDTQRVLGNMGFQLSAKADDDRVSLLVSMWPDEDVSEYLTARALSLVTRDVTGLYRKINRYRS